MLFLQPSKTPNPLITFSILGIVISLYLTYVKLTNSKIICGLGSCDIVQTSPYSSIFGIPVATFGVAFYFVLFCLAYYHKGKYLKIWTSIGLLFSAYLTYLELFVIHAVCLWCVGSAILAIASFTLAFGNSGSAVGDKDNS